jgi:hypothetical protein
VRHEAAHDLYDHERENDNEGPADSAFVRNSRTVAMAMPMDGVAMPMLMAVMVLSGLAGTV